MCKRWKLFIILLEKIQGQYVNKEDVPNNNYFDSSAEEFITYYERCSKYNTTRNEIIHNSYNCLVNVDDVLIKQTLKKTFI